MLKIILILCALFYSISLQATTDTAFVRDLELKIKQYNACKGYQGLYLHTDKTNYTHRETIWFTAYQLSPADTVENTLFVVLQQIGADTIVSVSRFVMSNGMGRGEIDLSDSLPSGTYRLLAFTNSQLGHTGRNVFQQTFVLSNEFREKYALLYAGTEQPAGANKDYQVHYRLILEEGSPAGNERITYSLSINKRTIAQETIKLSESGMLSVPVPLKYKDSLLSLHAFFTHEEDTQRFVMPLSIAPGLKVGFYPESGHLLEGVPNKMAFEIRPGPGQTTIPAGTILENGTPVAALKADRQGRGYFTFTPVSGKTYTLHLETGLAYDYQFPVIEQKGAILSIGNGSVRDIVPVTITSQGAGNQFYLVLHNYKEVFAVREILDAGKQTVLTIPLQDIPVSGVLTLTLLDGDKKPVAERCIFMQPETRVNALVNTDQQQYAPRTKVKLKVQLKDDAGHPLKGIFSIGCASADRVDGSRITSLPAFYYAGQYLPSAGEVIPDFDPEDTSAINLMLLTQFWTKYRWEEMLSVKGDPYDPLVDKVSVRFYYNDRPVAKPINYAIIKGKEIQMGETDNAGNANLSYESLYAQPDQYLGITALTKEKGRYKNIKYFSLATNFDAIDQAAWATASGNSSPLLRYLPEETYVLKGKNLLKEVKVTTGKVYRRMTDFVSRNCNDYVCLYDFLNCPNHVVGGFPARDGCTYWQYISYSRNLPPIKVRTLYIGCPDKTKAEFLVKVNATWQNKEFYVFDYSKEINTVTDKRSTLFWSHQVVANEAGEAELECYTNDLPGRYAIHLQGFSSKGPVSGTGRFFVSDQSDQ